MLAWWSRLTSEERNALMAAWPPELARECEELADLLVTAGVERELAERKALEQLLVEMYPERVLSPLPCASL